MKKFIVIFFLASLAFGQSWSGQSTSDARVVGPYRFCFGPDNGSDNCIVHSGINTASMTGFLDFKLVSKTVATLPVASSSKGRIYWVSDGATASDCTTGLGTNYVLCVSTGTVWQGAGGGGGGTGNIDAGTANSQAPNWSVSGNKYVPQAKNIYDVRDWATCDTTVGTSTGTDATNGIGAMLTAIGSKQATVRILGSTNPFNSCLVNTISWPANVTLDFSGGGSLTMITTVTPPGGGAVDGTAVGNFNVATFNTGTSSCSVTLNVPTNGDAVALFSTFHFQTGNTLGLPTDTKNNIYRLVSSSDADPNHYSTNSFAWVASNVTSGNVTITIPWTGTPANMCGAVAISGLGPSVGADASVNCFGSCGTGNPMSTVGAATYTAGSFLLSFGGQTSTAETCTAGAGFTQILNIGTNASLCAQTQNSAAGGPVTATQTINTTPTGSTWSYSSFGLKPVTATQFILGGIFNPNMRQIFYGALPGQGSVDFTGNLISFEVHPEWWGAFPSATAAVNTPAAQAAIYGAFGTSRTNASGLSKYNKPLHLSGPYQINDELKWYNINNFVVNCDGRLKAGFIQTAANKRIMDSQSMTYGSFHDCVWQGNASSTTALLDIDWNGVATPGDLKPQFLDFYNNSFIGNNLVDVGLLGAKSGGAAQFSNIYLYDPAFQGFTGAGFQIGGNGTGRNVGRSYATNALAVNIYGGDFQGCPLYGFADYGGGYIEIDNTSFECVSPWASYLTSVTTSVDVYCEGGQGPCILNNTRSEDLRLIQANNVKMNNVANNDQSTAFYSPVNCIVGATEPINWFIHGSDLGSDGAVYQVTATGTPFVGSCLVHASSGTPTTITDTNQTVAGSVTQGAFTSAAIGETMTQAVTGSTGTRITTPASTGTITGSVTSGTIGSAHTMTQAVTGVTCTSTNAPTGSTSLTCNNFSGAPNNSNIWTDGTTGGTYTPTSTPTFSVASPTLIISAATGAPDNSHVWTGGTTGAVYTPTGVPTNEVNWTVNAFATGAPGQQQVTIWGGTGKGQICGPITANTATSITFTGCTTNFYGVHSGNADSTSTFIVEPYWSANPTSNGGFTIARRDVAVIGGDNSQSNQNSSVCSLTDISAAGGLIQCSSGGSTTTHLNNVTVTRPDWYGPLTGIKLSDAVIGQRLDGVRIRRPYTDTAGVGTAVNWNIAVRNGSPVKFTAPLQTQMGTVPLVWSCGVAGGGTSCNDVSIGGRTDPDATTNIFRNRVEFTGMLGAPAPSGFNMTDQAGAATSIGGGPSTGAGAAGPIDFYTSNVTASGATVNSGTKRWSVTGAGDLTATGAMNLTTTGTVSAGSFTATGGSSIVFTNNCAAVGSAANPSIAACAAAPVGAFACDVAASGGTCQVNSTAVTANSRIFVTINSSAGANLGVTCATGANITVIPTVLLAAKNAGTSFTINAPTFTVNPVCFDFLVVN